MKISMIVAMAHNRVIGKDNKMPWHLPADLQWFKSVTSGSPILMGRKTYDSIGRPLPKRLNIVLSRNNNLKIEGCSVVNSLDSALSIAQNSNRDDISNDELFIVGGANLYEAFIDKADRLYLTLIDEAFEGDTFFPDYSVYEWQEMERVNHLPDTANPHAYSFITLDRIR